MPRSGSPLLFSEHQYEMPVPRNEILQCKIEKTLSGGNTPTPSNIDEYRRVGRGSSQELLLDWKDIEERRLSVPLEGHEVIESLQVVRMPWQPLEKRQGGFQAELGGTFVGIRRVDVPGFGQKLGKALPAGKRRVVLVDDASSRGRCREEARR